MKIIVLTLSGMLLSMLTFSQSNCANIDFEDGDFTNWTLTMGASCSSSHGCYTNPSIGTNSTDPLNLQRHVVYDTAGNDADALPVELICPFTGSNTIRLGNYSAGNGAEEMFRQYQLGENDTTLKFHYAYVTTETSNHGLNLIPFFLVEILDSVGNPFVPAINFYLESTDPSLGVLQTGVKYKDWTTINFDVSAVKGREVRIRILNSDCGYGGHEGRVYFDISCSFNTTGINEKNINTGFDAFPNPTSRYIKINTQSEGEVYFYSIKGDLLNTYKVSKGRTEFELDYNKGIYFVKFVSVTGTIKTRKIQVID